MNNITRNNEKIIKNIASSMAIEGMHLEQNDINLINSFLNNEITEQEGIEKIKSEFMNMK